MSSAHDPIASADHAEQLLGSLTGVVSAHVVADATGDIVEIHVLSTGDLHPKQMVRNVESALSAGLGLEIDRRIVSVAQIQADVDSNGQNRAGTAAAAADGAAAGSTRVDADAGLGTEAVPDPESTPQQAALRLEFVRYQSRRDAERCACAVTLRSGQEEVTGSGTGPDTAAGRAEAAARAVFDGIGQAQPEIHIELEAAVISDRRDRGYVIVAAHAVLDRETVRLAGAAPLTRSPEEAAILAALQATNRWIA